MPMARWTSSSVATPTTVEYSDSNNMLGSLRRNRPVSISPARKARARSNTGPTRVASRDADNDPGLDTSRTRPSSSGRRTAMRNTRRTIVSTWAKPTRPVAAASSNATTSASPASSITASNSARLDGNQ
jgi:hypothetical protein